MSNSRASAAPQKPPATWLHSCECGVWIGAADQLAKSPEHCTFVGGENRVGRAAIAMQPIVCLCVLYML